MLLGILLYGYCLGVRSSRQLERRCTEDIAFRVLAANRTLDKLNGEVAMILAEAADADRRDDAEHGRAPGNELPAALASKASRLARLRQAKALLEADAAARAERFAERVAAHTADAAAKGKPPRTLRGPAPGRGARLRGDRQRH